MSRPARPFTAFLVAGEESGDQLGARLMIALRRARPDAVFLGVGGGRMAAEGLRPLFPLADIAVNGLTAILSRLPLILRRIRETAAAAAAARPDVVVIIDSPDFTHPVARRLRRADPSIPVVDYVSPTVWVWRAGRARRMRAYVDHVLAVLPFEPEVHRRLGGPACSYVGHPLIERLDVLRPAPAERPPLGSGPPTLLVLPGSRHGEIARLLAPFGETVAATVAAHGPVELLLPAVPHLLGAIREGVAAWPVKPTIVEGEAEKFAAFRRAHAALAASGTVTLELALSAVPLVVAYRTDFLVRRLKWLGKVSSIVLPNLVLGENAVPEFIDEDSTPARMAAALAPLLADTPARRAQLAAFARLDGLMTLPAGTPSGRAAEIVLDTAQKKAAGRAGG